MKIVNFTDYLEEIYGPRTAVKMLANAGFEGIDYSMNEHTYGTDRLSTLKAYKDSAHECSLPFLQTHGPMPGAYQPWLLDMREVFYRQINYALEAAAYLEAPSVVLHPMRTIKGTHEEQLNINLEEYGHFLKRAEELGVTILIENMCSTKIDINGNTVEHVCKKAVEHAQYIDAFASPYIKACFDTGHAACSGMDIANFVRTLGNDRLKGLHVHDNDLIGDNHALPYTRSINFAPFLDALAEIGYTGDFTLECISLRTLPSELHESALRHMRDVAAYMRDTIVSKTNPCN